MLTLSFSIDMNLKLDSCFTTTVFKYDFSLYKRKNILRSSLRAKMSFRICTKQQITSLVSLIIIGNSARCRHIAYNVYAVVSYDVNIFMRALLFRLPF